MVLNLFRREAPRPAAEASLAHRVEAILGRASQIPPLPDTVAQALAVANDPDCRVEDFTALVERDGGLALAMLPRSSNASVPPPAWTTASSPSGTPSATACPPS